VGSIPTAPTNHLPDWSGFNKFARGQKGADKAIDPVLVRQSSAARVTTGFASLHRLRGNIIVARRDQAFSEALQSARLRFSGSQPPQM